MDIFDKIQRHAAVASGDFAHVLQDVELPPLPAVTARLVEELNEREPDPRRLARVIGATPVLSADTPRPPGDLFQHHAFWVDSLVRAILARSFARERGITAAEEAFTAMLLSDIALPVLLTVWREHYQPVVEEWQESAARLSHLERKRFRWDHAQAGAWILRHWGFADELVCFAGIHNLTLTEIRDLGLEGTMAVPMAVASLTPSVLKEDPERAERMITTALEGLSLSPRELARILAEAEGSLSEIVGLFDLDPEGASRTLAKLAAAASSIETGVRS